MEPAVATRPLTDQERRLARWMLEHGGKNAQPFLSQLDQAEATTWRCVCGCASFNFKVGGFAEAPPGVNILGDYVFGGEDELAGVFIFQSNGVLSGLEVYGLSGEAPSQLPDPDALRPFESVIAGAAKQAGSANDA